MSQHTHRLILLASLAGHMIFLRIPLRPEQPSLKPQSINPAQPTKAVQVVKLPITDALPEASRVLHSQTPDPLFIPPSQPSPTQPLPENQTNLQPQSRLDPLALEPDHVNPTLQAPMTVVGADAEITPSETTIPSEISPVPEQSSSAADIAHSSNPEMIATHPNIPEQSSESILEQGPDEVAIAIAEMHTSLTQLKASGLIASKSPSTSELFELIAPERLAAFFDNEQIQQPGLLEYHLAPNRVPSQVYSEVLLSTFGHLSYELEYQKEYGGGPLYRLSKRTSFNRYVSLIPMKSPTGHSIDTLIIFWERLPS